MTNERYERGLKTLQSINDKEGEQVLKILKDVSPDMARFVIEFAYGDIYSRKTLDLKTRELMM